MISSNFFFVNKPQKSLEQKSLKKILERGQNKRLWTALSQSEAVNIQKAIMAQNGGHANGKRWS